MDICICDDCFIKLENMGVIYQIYLDILLQYLDGKKPISMKTCQCIDHQKIMKMIEELESMKYIKIFEKSLCEILIVPNGIDISKEMFDGVFICNCEFQL